MTLIDTGTSIINADQITTVEPEYEVVGQHPSGILVHSDTIVGCNIGLTDGRCVALAGVHHWRMFADLARATTLPAYRNEVDMQRREGERKKGEAGATDGGSRDQSSILEATHV